MVVPRDDEFRRRVSEREAIEGKEIPDNAVLNMKSNFVLPELEETFFVEVFYIELGPEEAHKVRTGTVPGTVGKKAGAFLLSVEVSGDWWF